MLETLMIMFNIFMKANHNTFFPGFFDEGNTQIKNSKCLSKQSFF